MDIFSRDESVGGRRVLFNLLCLFGEPAMREAQKRLRDPRAYYVRNLLIFIRRAGTPASMPHIKPLLQHREQSVRMEALSTLLKFKDPGSVKLLRECDPFRTIPTSFRRPFPWPVSTALPTSRQDVLARIKQVILFEADYRWNEEIIKALGEIGDPRAIPDLEKLARATWSLYPQGRLRMKEMLFESLGRYPRERLAQPPQDRRRIEQREDQACVQKIVRAARIRQCGIRNVECGIKVRSFMAESDVHDKLSRVISLLTAAVTNTSLYSPTHPQVALYIEKAYAGLSELLRQKPEVTVLLDRQ